MGFCPGKCNDWLSWWVKNSFWNIWKIWLVNKFWKYIQGDFECCGIDSYKDWESTKYGKAVDGVPDSCCMVHAADCGKDIFSDKGAAGINRGGCSKLLEEFIERQMTSVEAMGFSIAILCVISLALLPGTGLHREYQSLQCDKWLSEAYNVTVYEGGSIERFPRALAPLSHQIYSSHWGQLKAISILFEWGYDTLISN